MQVQARNCNVAAVCPYLSGSVLGPAAQGRVLVGGAAPQASQPCWVSVHVCPGLYQTHPRWRGFVLVKSMVALQHIQAISSVAVLDPGCHLLRRGFMSCSLSKTTDF